MYSKAHLESVCPDFSLIVVIFSLQLRKVTSDVPFLRCSFLDPGLPAREQSAEVFGVHGLLDEQVDLPPDTKYCALL